MKTEVVSRTSEGAADEIPGPEPFGVEPAVLAFKTEPNSPWPDGYSLEGERAALADLLDRDDAEVDPRWPRVLELEKREEEFKRAMSNYRQRRGADPLVSDAEVTSMRRLGSLVDIERDVMVLHTAQAHRLFMGRAPSPDKHIYAIPGGKRQGSALRFLWLLTANDNPYADWALLRHEQGQKLLREAMDAAIAMCSAKIETLREKGLVIGVMKSSEPQEMELGFKSPYAYAVCELIVDYDRFVRFVVTLMHKDQLSDKQGRELIQDVTRKIRAHWIEITNFERFLTRPEVRELSRSDFLPTADAEGRKRALAVSERFRGLPTRIFEGSLMPAHSRRRQAGRLSPQERVLLHETAKQIEALDAQAADQAREAETEV